FKLALMSAIVAGCNPPQRGASVAREGDHYVISVLNCGDKKWDDPPIWEMLVGKSPPGVSVATQCDLQASPELGSEPRYSLMQWRYGSQPKGYILKHCAPLEPGATYEVYASARPMPAIGHFALASNGDVIMLDGECHR